MFCFKILFGSSWFVFPLCPWKNKPYVSCIRCVIIVNTVPGIENPLQKCACTFLLNQSNLPSKESILMHTYSKTNGPNTKDNS